MITGDVRNALREIAEGLADYAATGALAWRTLFLALPANAYRQAGRIDEGLSTIKEAREAVAVKDEYWWDAELLRSQDDLLLAMPRPDDQQAERLYRKSLKVARRQQARSWEVRTATSLARLHRGQGRRAEARELLVPVQGWFTEGFDTADPRDAKVLLDDRGVGWQSVQPVMAISA